jgi:membrane associated rhomboid family serine protease
VYYLYWLPIGTDAKVRKVPWATFGLLAANILAFAAVRVLPEGEAGAYLLTFRAGQPSIATAITSLFLHPDPLQLLGNLLFLGVFGPPLESRLGSGLYLVAAIASGWLANLIQAAWILYAAPELSSAPILGAGGVVSGILGLFVVRLYFARLRFGSLTMLLRQGVVKAARFTLPAWIGVVLWVILQSAGLARAATPELKVLCHASAFAFGVVFGWAIGSASEGRLESRLARAARFASRGEWFASLGEFESYLEQRPDDAEVVAQIGRLERVTHQDAESAEHFRRAIHLWLAQGEIRRACDAYDEMKRLLGPVPLPPADLLRVARGCEGLRRPSEASRAYEAYGRTYPDRHGSALALLKSAEIEHGFLNNPGRARYIYDELLQRSLDPELLQVVRERAGRLDAAGTEQNGNPARAL